MKEALEKQYRDIMAQFGATAMDLRELNRRRAALKARLRELHEEAIGASNAVQVARAAAQSSAPADAGSDGTTNAAHVPGPAVAQADGDGGQQ